MSYPLDFSKLVRDAAAAAVTKEVPKEQPFEKTYPGAVRGGTKMVDFSPSMEPIEGMHVRVGPPPVGDGARPEDYLFRKIAKDRGGEIAANITTDFYQNRNGFISTYTAGASAVVSAGTTHTPGIPADVRNAIDRRFDIDFAKAVIDWCDTPSNKNGAQLKVPDGALIAYDKSMVDEIRTNANNLLKVIEPKKESEPTNKDYSPDFMRSGRFRNKGLQSENSLDDQESPGYSITHTAGKNISALLSAALDIQNNATQTNSTQSFELFKNNPTVQQVSAAMERNGIAPESQNPSLVAGLAGASASLSKVQDVALTPTTAFALDRDKFDPAANRASVSMDVANKPFDEVWKTASVALQQTQAPAVVAQAQDLEQKQSQSAPRM